jgi:serine/threonine protein kinase
VEHEYVVRTYGLFADDLNLYLVLELVEGGELFEQVQLLVNSTQRGFEEVVARRLFRSVVKGIHHMHKTNVAHWDLKPQVKKIKNKVWLWL